MKGYLLFSKVVPYIFYQLSGYYTLFGENQKIGGLREEFDNV
jgi:hypothetical protein